ncbi:MAG: hypothetical protein AB1349_04175 [Elusimicrobiota bacterium]
MSSEYRALALYYPILDYSDKGNDTCAIILNLKHSEVFKKLRQHQQIEQLQS